MAYASLRQDSLSRLRPALSKVESLRATKRPPLTQTIAGASSTKSRLYAAPIRQKFCNRLLLAKIEFFEAAVPGDARILDVNVCELEIARNVYR